MDPWYWTVEDVVANFCRSDDLWTTWPSAKPLDTVTLEDAFRKNAVDGATLLVNDDPQTFKNELGIMCLGTWTALWYAIEMLRSRSPQYISFKATIESRRGKIMSTAQALNPAPSAPRDISNLSQDSTAAICDGTGRLTEMLKIAPVESQRPTLRSGEYLVLEKGKKRRKLQLEQLEPRIGARSQRAGLDIIAQSRSKVSDSYLSHSMITLDSLFYGGTTSARTPLDHDDTDADEASTEQEFALPIGETQQASQGTIQFINRRLRHFFMTSPVRLDKSRVVHYPYPERLAKSKNGRTARLFKISENGISVAKKDAAMINIEQETGPDEFVELDHSWDHLLLKWPSGEEEGELLPLYNASGSENDYSESLWDELEQELLELEQLQSIHPDEQPPKFVVREVVEEEIARYCTIWDEKNISRRQSAAKSVWKKGQGRNRAQLLNATKLELQRLSLRLEKLIDEICSEYWASEKSLRKQCGCLEGTIASQRKSEWKLRLWSASKPPLRHYAATAKSTQNPTKVLYDSDGGESLGSESDNTDDFIDIDDVAAANGNQIDRFWNKSPIPRSAESQISLAGYNLTHSQRDPTLGVNLQLQPQCDEETIENLARDADPNRNALYYSNILRRQRSEDTVLGIRGHTDGVELGRHQMAERLEVIDLTTSSPNPNPSNDGFANELFKEAPYERVEVATKAEIANWNWTDLDEQSDRKRIILKLLHSMEKRLQERVQLHFAKNTQQVLKNQVKIGLGAIKRGDDVNVDRKNKETLKAICKLFVCWNDGNHRHFEHTIPALVMQSALKAKDFATFFGFFKDISATANQSDAEDDCEDPSPRKKRHRKVLKNLHGRALREKAQERRATHELRLQNGTVKIASTIDTDLARSAIIVNTMKHESDELIFLNPHIAEKVKPHQVDGIRFLWREIVTVEQPLEMQGCLLAHTMGLGKTMQAISLLVTIAEAAASLNPLVVNQVPLSLRQSKTLILCPPGLIENWKDELKFWIPRVDTLGNIFDASSETQLQVRLATISEWYNSGGILIMGYEMFRSLILNESTGNLGRPLLEYEQHKCVENQLLQGPSIVVADEAHKMKQQKSKIAQVTKSFQTPSRIALTGSPLANNLQDYFSMIDWAAEGYLGNAVEFKAHYQEPIEAGTYADSTNFEQRMSLKRLCTLLNDIGPKVNRADISAIQHDIPPKTEFVIKMPLAEWQTTAYSEFVEAVLERGQGQIVQSKLFDWMTVLSLLCSHPSIFLKKLSERAEQRSKSPAIATELPESNETLMELTPAPAGISKSMVSRQYEICKGFGIEDKVNPVHSFKMVVIKEILTHAKSLNDRVLLFSQYIPTLDYIEHLIERLLPDLESFRLDGNTNMEHRLRMVKRFNAGEGDVFLISTKAGSLGLNISGANRVIMVDFSFNPTHEEQAVARAYRMGQQKEVFVYHLVAGGTYEEKLHNTTIFKKQLASRVVDKKNPARSASKGVVQLFAPKPVEQENLDECKGKDVIMDRILSGDVAKFIRSLQTADTMHKEIDERLTEKELEEEEEARIAAGRLRRRDYDLWDSNKKAEGEQSKGSDTSSFFSARHEQDNFWCQNPSEICTNIPTDYRLLPTKADGSKAAVELTQLYHESNRVSTTQQPGKDQFVRAPEDGAATTDDSSNGKE